jgi:hypothetical protein
LVLGRRATIQSSYTQVIIIPGSANLIPGWAGLNSRFGWPREFAGKGLILLAVFATNGGYMAKIDKIPGSTGKTVNFC